MTLMAACGPPGGGRNVISPRLLKHFRYVCSYSMYLTLRCVIAIDSTLYTLFDDPMFIKSHKSKA